MAVRDGNAWRRRRTRIVCGLSVTKSIDGTYNKATTGGDFGIKSDDDFPPGRAGLRGCCSSVYSSERHRVARWWYGIIVLIFATILHGVVGFSGGCSVAHGLLSSSSSPVKPLTYRYCCSMKERRKRSSCYRCRGRNGENIIKTLAVMSSSLNFSMDAFDAFDTLPPGSGKEEETKGGAEDYDHKRLLGVVRVCAPL